ncbi:hypothetical protein H0H87_004644, partial [Tephrocybe sp. NHM501043]
MLSNDPLEYALMCLLSLYLLSYFNSATLNYLYGVAQAFGKASGISATDVLYAFGGFLVTQPMLKGLARARKGIRTVLVTRKQIERRPVILATARNMLLVQTSLATRLFENAIQVLLSMRDFAMGVAAYWT